MRPGPVAAAVLIGFAGFVGFACTGHHPGPYRAAVPPLPAEHPGDRGHVLYLRDCAWCHGAAAEGTPRAPDLKAETRGAADVDFVLRTRRMPLRRPDEPMRRGTAAIGYSAADRRAIVDFVASLGPNGPPVPTVAASPPPLFKGAELYLANCAACHSSTGIGGTLSAAQRSNTAAAAQPDTFAPAVLSSGPVEVAEAIRVGPGTMPVFGPQTLSDTDVDAIAHYVQYLRNPSDPGGLAAGHLGPVSEGAIGWIIGLGLLLGVARWIGSRTGEEPSEEPS